MSLPLQLKVLQAVDQHGEPTVNALCLARMVEVGSGLLAWYMRPDTVPLKVDDKRTRKKVTRELFRGTNFSRPIREADDEPWVHTGSRAVAQLTRGIGVSALLDARSKGADYEDRDILEFAISRLDEALELDAEDLEVQRQAERVAYDHLKEPDEFQRLPLGLVQTNFRRAVSLAVLKPLLWPPAEQEGQPWLERNQYERGPQVAAKVSAYDIAEYHAWGEAMRAWAEGATGQHLMSNPIARINHFA